MERQPLVSCLCVTKNNLNQLTRSIDCFKGQTYHNKELVIVKQGRDEIIREYLKGLPDDNIFYVEVPPNSAKSLGELRNISLENCRGDFFCTWDDDDWQHVDRIKMQVEATLRSFHTVSALTNLLVFNELTKRLYFSGFRLWEGTILCEKKWFLNGMRYPAVSKREDTSFLSLLHQHTRVLPVVNSTHFIYIYHGKNTWDLNHFNAHIFNQPLSNSASEVAFNLMANIIGVGEASNIIDSSCIPKEVNHFYRK